MPNIVYRWDFEDGTSQGWKILASGWEVKADQACVQGSYCLAGPVNVGDLIEYDGLDLTSVKTPLLIIPASLDWPACPVAEIIDPSTGTVIDQIYAVAGEAGHYIPHLFDLSKYAGQTINLRITIVGAPGGIPSYIDNIQLVDGPDNVIDAAYLSFDDYIAAVHYPYPSALSDVAALGAARLAVVGVHGSTTPPNIDHMNVTLRYNSTGALQLQQRWCARAAPTSNIGASVWNVRAWVNTQISSLDELIVKVYRPNFNGEYAYHDERLFVVLADGEFNLLRIDEWRLHYTFNPWSPPVVTRLIQAQPGTPVSGSAEYSLLKVHAASSASVALRCRFTVGDHTLVTSGTVTLSIYDSSGTLVGSSSVDLTAGDDVTGAFVDIKPDTDYTARIDWKLTASGRVAVEALLVVKAA